MLYQSCWNNLVTGLIVPSSLLQFVNSLFQTCSNKFGTSSANTSCQQLVNRLVTTCLQVCSNLCVFTCVVQTQSTTAYCRRLRHTFRFNNQSGCRSSHSNHVDGLACVHAFVTWLHQQYPQTSGCQDHVTFFGR